MVTGGYVSGAFDSVLTPLDSPRCLVAFDRAGFYHEVGLRLSKCRKDRQLTQEQVAGRVGIPRATYASIEGGRQRIVVDVLWRAAIVLEVPLDALVPEPVPEQRVATRATGGPETMASATTAATVVGTDLPDTAAIARR